MRFRRWLALISLAALPLVACGGGALNPDGGGTPPDGSPTTPPGDPIPAGPASIQSFTFHSKLLGDSRSVWIYLPPQYETDTSRHYPVLYMQDGEAVFAATSANPSGTWRVDETASALITAGHITPLIVVGVASNSATRSYDYQPSTGAFPQGRGQTYETMLATELKPYVDAHYRTRTDAAHTGIAGSSLGGIIAGWSLFAHHDVFGRGAALSAAFLKPSDPTPGIVKGFSGNPGIRFYFSRGTKDGEAANQQYEQDFRNLLLSKGWVDGTDFQYELVPGATHSVAAWTQRVDPFLRLLFPPGS